MKKTLSIIGGMLVAAGCYAWEPVDFVSVACVVSTNAAAETTYTTAKVNGHVSAVILDFGGTASPTCTVAIATSAAGPLGPARTILSKAAVAGDDTFYPRGIVDTVAGVDIANVPAEIPVNGSFTVTMYAANVTGVTCTAYIVIK